MNCCQDMPPPGGYKPLVYQKVPLKTISIYLKLGGLMCAAALGWVGFHMSKREEGNARIEMRCGDIALLPFYYAETDRMLLKQLKKNRDYEEKLMKNVPGWEVGKWKGYQVFLSVGPNEYFKPSLLEFFAHGDPDVMWKVHHAVQNS